MVSVTAVAAVTATAVALGFVLMVLSHAVMIPLGGMKLFKVEA